MRFSASVDGFKNGHTVMMTSSDGYVFRVTGPCTGNSPVTGEFPAQRPVTRSFDVFFHLSLNKQLKLSKQSQGRWFETPSCPLWHHCNGIIIFSFGVAVLPVDYHSCDQFTHIGQGCFTDTRAVISPRRANKISLGFPFFPWENSIFKCDSLDMQFEF